MNPEATTTCQFIGGPAHGEIRAVEADRWTLLVMEAPKIREWWVNAYDSTVNVEAKTHTYLRYNILLLGEIWPIFAHESVGAARADGYLSEIEDLFHLMTQVAGWRKTGRSEMVREPVLRMIDAFAAIRELHVRDPADTLAVPFCEECLRDWPCPTLQAIEQARAV